MKYKLLSMDFDGTLLDHHYSMSPRVKAALIAAAEAGVTLCANTGRPFSEMLPYLEGIPGFAYAVTTNGCVAHCLPGGELLHEAVIPREQCLKLVDLVSGQPLLTQMYVDGVPLSEEYSRELTAGEASLTRYRETSGNQIRYLANYRDYFTPGAKLPNAFFILSHDLELIGRLEAEISLLEGVSYTSSTSGSIEVLPAGLSKAVGLAAVCRHMGITPEEVMAIGDNENDVEMLTLAGLGVAMGNGTENVKRHADCITKSVTEDGAALAIEHFIRNAGAIADIVC